MGKLLSFPGAMQHGLAVRKANFEAAKANFDSMTKTLGMACDFLDQIVVAIEHLESLLPTGSLKACFEKQRTEIADQINQAHLKLAEISDFSNDHLQHQTAE